MDSKVTVEQALHQGMAALEAINNTVPGTAIAGLAIAAMILVAEVLDAIIEAAEGGEEAVN